MAALARSRPLRNRRLPARGRPALDNTERERILKATTAVFLEMGFQRASTNVIAHRARSSKQTLYSLFPTKADLFTAVMSAQTEELYSHHVEYIESGKPPRQALTEMGTMLLNLFSSPNFLALYRILIAEAENFPDLARQLWHLCAERGYTLLAEYLESRRIGGPAWRKSAVQFVSIVLGDLVLKAMLNPGHAVSKRELNSRVREAVNHFLLLHSEPNIGKQSKSLPRKLR